MKERNVELNDLMTKMIRRNKNITLGDVEKKIISENKDAKASCFVVADAFCCMVSRVVDHEKCEIEYVSVPVDTKLDQISSENVYLEKELNNPHSELCKNLDRYFTSNRLMDSFIEIEFKRYTCQQIEELYSDVKKEITRLVKEIRKTLSEHGIEEDKTVFVILWNHTYNYLLNRYYRESISFDASLRDNRIYIGTISSFIEGI